MGKTQTPCARAQRNNLIFCFALAMVLVGGIYLLLGFWPFGDGTMLTGDLNGQYVAYLADLKRRAAEGGFFTASPSCAAAVRWGCSPITWPAPSI